ncbi:MAG: WbqC family protein [candidate division Zixibacteria bacterium]|nr:WbqC family protein [candidate division Zixibacteria bacterium]
MIVSIHQPNFLPWLGFFEKVDRSDLFILLDDVQFEKNDWQNRNRIKGPSGAQWLTVPVRHRYPQIIAETQIDPSSDWRRKHWNAIVSNYRKAGYFDNYAPQLEPIYRQEWERLADFNVDLLKQTLGWLGIATPLRRASEFNVNRTSSERLAVLCEATGADMYLAGAGGHGYLDITPFETRNIRVEFQEYTHPVYPQLFGAFVSHLSILDLLMNCGERSLFILRGAHQPENPV